MFSLYAIDGSFFVQHCLWILVVCCGSQLHLLKFHHSFDVVLFWQEKLNLFFLNKWQWISEDLWKCFLKLLIAESVRCFYLYCYWIHWNQFFNYRYVSDWYLLRTKLNLSHSEIDTFQLRSIYVHSRHFYMVPPPPPPPRCVLLCCVVLQKSKSTELLHYQTIRYI